MSSPKHSKKQKKTKNSSEMTSESLCSSQQLDITRSGINNLRSQRNDFDFFIVCEDEKFPAHRLILRTGSPYFDAMFSSGLQEVSSSEISLPTISKKSMAFILDSLYLQKVNICTLSVEETIDLLSAAHLLQICPVVQMCIEELFKKINGKSWDLVLRAAIKYSVNRLIIATVQYLSYHEQWFGNEKLQKLEFGSFYVLITTVTKDAYYSADLLVKLIVNWVAYEADREKHLPELLSSINFSLASKEILASLINDNCLSKSSLELSNLLLKKIAAAFNSVDSSAPKSASSYPKLLTFLSDAVHSYDFFSQEHIEHNFPQNVVPILHCPMAAADNAVYFIAYARKDDGSTRRDIMNITAFYPAVNSEAIVATCASNYRFAMLCMNDVLYFTAGCDLGANNAANRVKYLKSFCLKSSTWKSLAEPITYRIGPEAIVACDKFYVFGGWDSFQTNNFVRNVERYCPVTNQWSLFTVMPPFVTNHSSVTVAAYFSKIYVAISQCTETYSSKLIEFDPEVTDSWKEIVMDFNLDFVTPVNNWSLMRSAKSLPFLVIRQDGKYYRMDPQTQHSVFITEIDDLEVWPSTLVIFA